MNELFYLFSAGSAGVEGDGAVFAGVARSGCRKGPFNPHALVEQTRIIAAKKE
jgi:hypothetical protein